MSKNCWTLVNALSFDEAVKIEATHAAHCMIYSKTDKKVLYEGRYALKANILMQFRFDGYFGFPGGLIDAGEDVIQGLVREIHEEVNFDLSKTTHTITPSNWICSTQGATYVNHFFALEVSPEEFDEIYSSKLHDDEVLGHVRVPLYTMTEDYHLGEGLPTFLNNFFAGCARPQLLLGLVKRGILAQQEVDDAVAISKSKPFEGVQ